MTDSELRLECARVVGHLNASLVACGGDDIVRESQKVYDWCKPSDGEVASPKVATFHNRARPVKLVVEREDFVSILGAIGEERLVWDCKSDEILKWGRILVQPRDRCLVLRSSDDISNVIMAF